MIKLLAATVLCLFMGWAVNPALAVPVSETVVENACGDQIEGGCAGPTCAMGCEKTENGKLYTYGCTFPNKTGKTKPNCTKEPMHRTQDRSRVTGLGDRRPALKVD